jgi:hypothetical protein
VKASELPIVRASILTHAFPCIKILGTTLATQLSLIVGPGIGSNVIKNCQIWPINEQRGIMKT